MSTAGTDIPALLDRLVREIPDWPEPGVTFRDITPVLADAEAFAAVIDDMILNAADFGEVDLVVGIEARGFILGAPIALRLGCGFVPVRKQGKLPAETLAASYDLEYGSETVEMHRDGLQAGHRALIVDDVLATGGTLAATSDLIEQSGAEVAGFLLLLELADLNGRQRLRDVLCRSMVVA